MAGFPARRRDSREGGHWVMTFDVLGWAGSALLVYSLLQTRILRLRLLEKCRLIVTVTTIAICVHTRTCDSAF